MSISARFTSEDLERLPAIEGIRYEIVDGDLFVSKQPHWHHQYASDGIVSALRTWDGQTGFGIAMSVPGVIFTDDNDVIPDVVWISHERLAAAEDSAGHLRAAPELVVEVLSPGREYERRDRQVKLALYARQGVQEYWIVDWQRQAVDVYRRSGHGQSHGPRSDCDLRPVATLAGAEALTTPLLPGFTCPLSSLWVPSR